MSSYIVIDIINQTGKTSPLADPYISIIGTSAKATANFWIQNDGTTCFNNNTKGSNVIQLSSLTGNIKIDSSLNITGGRIYFSSSPTVITSETEPSITTSDYYFDWVEFTLSGSDSQLVVNTTQVDQFGFPIKLMVNPPDQNFGSEAGILMDRESLISSFKNALSTPYLDCLLPNADQSDYYRILSPNQAIVLNSNSQLSNTFTTIIDDVFSYYSTANNDDSLANNAKVSIHTLYLDSNRAYPYKANVTTITEADKEGNLYNYPVLQFSFATDAPINPGIPTTPPEGTGPYNIFYPFFTTNNPSGHDSFNGDPILPPPAWWYKKQNKGLLDPTESPSQMVFAGDGVFSDAFWQFATNSPTPQTQVLGNLQNQVDVAFNRGHAKSWFTLVGKIAPSGDKNTQTGLYSSTVTLNSSAFTDQNIPNTTANLAVGMYAISLAADIPLQITEIIDTQNFTIASPQKILAYNPLYLTFANFYSASGTWNEYAKFFHETEVSIGGRAYALSFDDQGGFSSTLTSNWTDTPTTLKITLGSWYKEFTVNSRKPWQNTGVEVNPNEAVTINYQHGDWSSHPENTKILYDANGNTNVIASQPGYTMLDQPEGALIGRVGLNGPPFLVGDGPTLVPSNQSGNLYLCINDDLDGRYGAGLTDNIGSVTVQIITSNS